jgi:hypothetical protein
LLVYVWTLQAVQIVGRALPCALAVKTARLSRFSTSNQGRHVKAKAKPCPNAARQSAKENYEKLSSFPTPKGSACEPPRFMNLAARA